MYPHGDYDSREKLLDIVGSFWSSTYAGRDLVASYLFSRAQEEKQSLSYLKEVVDCTSISTCPVFSVTEFYPLKLKKSERNTTSANLLKFNSEADFGPQADTGVVYEFDIPLDNTSAAYPIPLNLISCDLITNRITNPSLTLVNGVDYVFAVEDNALIFREDPFNSSSLFSTSEIYTNNEITDYELTVWLFKAKFDLEDLYYQYGYVSGPKLQSSKSYKNLIEWTLRAYNEGASGKFTARLLAAITGIPITKSPSETVELIQRDNNNLVIATDKNVYKFDPNDDPIVSVNTSITADQPLVSGFRIFELNRGIVPEGLDRLTVGRGFIKPSCSYSKDGELTFVNEDLPTTVSTKNGFTEIRFPLYGFDCDVEGFWNTVHENGVSAQATLAQLLDTRETPEGQPTAHTLPSTINPLKFLISNILRFNAFVVKIDVTKCRSELGLTNIRLLRNVIPVWTAAIILFEINSTEDFKLTNETDLELTHTSEHTETLALTNTTSVSTTYSQTGICL